jgi:maltooligosyltrehalose synthase
MDTNMTGEMLKTLCLDMVAKRKALRIATEGLAKAKTEWAMADTEHNSAVHEWTTALNGASNEALEQFDTLMGSPFAGIFPKAVPQ